MRPRGSRSAYQVIERDAGVCSVVELSRRYLVGAVGKDGVEVSGNQGDLVIEVLLADGLKVLLAAPCGPFRLYDCAVTGEAGAAETRRDPRSDDSPDDNCDDSYYPCASAYTTICGLSCLVTPSARSWQCGGQGFESP
jgi:hypothetical protein